MNILICTGAVMPIVNLYVWNVFLRALVHFPQLYILPLHSAQPMLQDKFPTCGNALGKVLKALIQCFEIHKNVTHRAREPRFLHK